jgi:hypothetical protein
MVKLEQLEKINPSKLALLIKEIHDENPAWRKSLDMSIAVAEDNAKKLISLIKKEINLINKATSIIKFKKIKSLEQRLDLLQSKITIGLKNINIKEAINLQLEFVEISDNLLNRCHDFDNLIKNIFINACSELAKLHENANDLYDEDYICNLIYLKVINNDNGVYDNIILDFVNIFTKNILTTLKLKLIEANKLKKVKNNILTTALKDIADVNSNVDEYIEACSFFNKVSNEESLAIATRLIKRWRAEEALVWLEKTKNLDDLHDRYYELKLASFEQLCNYSEANNIRLTWFDYSLDPIVYGQIISNLKDREEFKKQAISKAYAYQNKLSALNFLIEIHEFEEAAEFVIKFQSKLVGADYNVLRTAAKILAKIHPLAATILYRILITLTLNDHYIKYYNYPAKYLAECKVLSTQITDWHGIEQHRIYFHNLQSLYSGKKGFWSAYNKLNLM